MSTRPVASVIVVNWNGLAHLRACLPPLARQAQAAGAEILVVDNGSRDESVAWIEQHLPQLRVLPLRRNLGFARANNLGMQLARGELLIALNNDTIPEPGFLYELLAVFEARPDVGMAAAVLTFAHRPELVASAGIVVERNGLALDLWPGRHIDDLPRQPLEIFGPSGGAAAYRRAMLADVGLFDPAFWMYLEDADLAWRARLAGWRCLLAPTARARHVYSASSGQGSPLKQRLLARNRLRLLVRCLPATLLARWLPAILAYDVAAAAFGLLRGQPATFAGRVEALYALPSLLRQRRAIQATRRVPTSTLSSLSQPARWPRHYLAQQRELEAVLVRPPS
jgi:GT2 family glycosyltransferase